MLNRQHNDLELNQTTIVVKYTIGSLISRDCIKTGIHNLKYYKAQLYM